MKDSPALSWAPVWVSVCLWAKLKDPSDSEQPERSTRRSSSPSRTSAKPWTTEKDHETTSRSNPHRTVNITGAFLLTSALECPQRPRAAPSSSQSTNTNNTISTETNNITREELKALHYLSSMLSATLMVAMRVPKDGATSESKAGVVKLNTNSVLYSARSID